MRLTNVLYGFRHSAMYQTSHKWDRLHGRRRINPGWFFQWKRMWRYRSKKEVTYLPVDLPDEKTEVIDAEEYVKESFKTTDYDFPQKWPFCDEFYKKWEPGSPQDPNYKKELGLVYTKTTKLYEGFKGSLNFVHGVLESKQSLPDEIKALEAEVEIDSNTLDFFTRHVNFALNTDGFVKKLHPFKKFPQISKSPEPQLGVPPHRKDINILRALYEAANLFIAKNVGIVDRRRLLYPECTLAFEREGKRCVFDLWCDFLTLSSKEQSTYCQPTNQPTKPFGEASTTTEKNLVDIHPVNWEICFDRSHLWTDKYEMHIPLQDQIHTIYIGDLLTRFKKYPDRFCQGRNILFSYGYAAAQFRRWYGNWDDFRDPTNYVDLDKPILINCIDYNRSKNTVGFACFQLNTLRFDSEIKNQVWMDGPFSIEDDQEKILKKVIAINMHGSFNSINETFLEKSSVQTSENRLQQ